MIRATTFVLMFCFASLAMAGEGIVSVKSAYSVSATLDRLEKVLKKKGMTIFKRIDHSAGAKGVGLKLRPTELLIFGNPKVGTKLTQCAQTAAIDLPMKALAWQDADGTVWLSYNDPAYLAKRHGAKDCKVVDKMTKALGNFSAVATKAE
ncbi:MAG: DUF302 domain-containing protein [Gammaproteobacteria bacterium]|nr:MAG: DUF302 domain-containing protein [Gammaproteobacteria bacterium]